MYCWIIVFLALCFFFSPTSNSTATMIYSIDLAEIEYQFTQYYNETIGLYCLQQLDYPVLSISYNSQTNELWLVFMSPVEHKQRVTNLIPLPKDAFHNNSNGIATSLMASSTDQSTYLLLYTQYSYNYIIYNILNNDYLSGVTNCNIGKGIIGIFESPNPDEIYFLSQHSKNSSWYLGSIQFVNQTAKHYSLDQQYSYCNFLFSLPIIDKNEEYYCGDINPLTNQIILIMSNNIYFINVEQQYTNKVYFTNIQNNSLIGGLNFDVSINHKISFI